MNPSVAERPNSPRQFYFTLLAMYVKAFAYIKYGSKGPATPAGARAWNPQYHAKCVRMLRASSHGLRRLIQFRRDIVAARQRAAVIVAARRRAKRSWSER